MLELLFGPCRAFESGLQVRRSSLGHHRYWEGVRTFKLKVESGLGGKEEGQKFGNEIYQLETFFNLNFLQLETHQSSIHLIIIPSKSKIQLST